MLSLPFEVANYVECMRKHRCREFALELRVKAAAVIYKQVARDEQICCTNRDVHRAGPVDAVPRWISRYPVQGLILEFSGSTITVAAWCRGRYRRLVLHSGKFPRH